MSKKFKKVKVGKGERVPEGLLVEGRHVRLTHKEAGYEARYDGVLRKDNLKDWWWCGQQPFAVYECTACDDLIVWAPVEDEPRVPGWDGAFIVRDKDGVAWVLQADGDYAILLQRQGSPGWGRLPGAEVEALYGPITVVRDAEGKWL